MAINYRFTILLSLVLICQSCAPKGHIGGKGKYGGCSEPPPDVFTSASIDAEVAKSTFGKFIIGAINIKTNPQVISLATKASMDDRIRDYLRCLAIHRDGFTKEQVAYFDRLSLFMQTNPSPEQFLIWQKKDPFPSTSTNQTIANNGKSNEGEKVITQKAINSPGAVQIADSQIEIHNDSGTFKNPSNELVSQLNDEFTSFRNKYAQNPPKIIIQTEAGNSRRKRVANFIGNYLQNYGIGYYDYTSTNSGRFPEHPIRIMCNQNNVDSTKDFLKIMSNYIKNIEQVSFLDVGHYGQENIIVIYFNGEPSFSPDGTIIFE